MFGLHLRNKSGKAIVVARIGSASVTLSLLVVKSGSPALVLATEQATLPVEARAPEHAIVGVTSILAEASKKLHEKYGALLAEKKVGNLESVYAILQAPWFSSKTSRVAAKFEGEDKITEATIRDLAKHAFEQEKEMKRENIFEAGVIRTELNGYPTNKPVGRRAHSAAVSAIISECDPQVRKSITDTLQHAFPAETFVLRSGNRALLSVLHESSLQLRERIVLNIGDDATNCIVVRRDVATENVLIPEGAQSILKRITGNGMPEETLSLMRMITSDTCSTPACDALNTSLASVEPELVRVFGEAMGHLATIRRLPNTLSIIVKPELAPWLLRFFSRIDFGQFTVTQQPFNASVFAPEDMSRLALPAEGFSIDADTALSASFVHIEEQES